jgi:hypothetical protein
MIDNMFESIFIGGVPSFGVEPNFQLDILYELSLLDLHRLFLIYCNVK